MSTLNLFHTLVAIHIATGAFGLIAFWVPIVGGKGSLNHRRFGRWFVNALLITGVAAIGMSTLTVIAPVATHPHLATHEVFHEPMQIRAIFGWMMLYLATLTVNLAWQGKLALANRKEPQRNRAWHNLLSQVLLTFAAVNCVWQGLLAGQWMMVGIAMVGFATVGTNLWFIYKNPLAPTDYIKEHIKSLVGAGISVYTAFFAFGAVRLIPELALTPGLWAVPLTTGLALIIYHQRAVVRRRAPIKPNTRWEQRAS
ncbi:MAG: hypothetical protein V2I45_07810 [Halieaceae bacterium]|jgi:hypothetical protein|nr:hypothetical protein [Halieaceae bacterium]